MRSRGDRIGFTLADGYKVTQKGRRFDIGATRRQSIRKSDAVLAPIAAQGSG